MKTWHMLAGLLAAAIAVAAVAWSGVGRRMPEVCPSVNVSWPPEGTRNEDYPLAIMREVAYADGLPPAVWFGLGRPRLLKAMLAIGVNPNLCWGGKSALHFAALSRSPSNADLLLDGGARIDRPLDADGGNALRTAIASGNHDVAQRLLARGAGIRDRSESPLLVDLALAHPKGVESDSEWRRKRLRLAHDLLARGAGADERMPGSGLSPLHAATTLPDAELVALLLAHGADPAAKTRRGQTPLSNARRLGDVVITRQLEEAMRRRSAAPPR